MSKVNLALVLAVTAVADGLVTDRFVISLSDATGVAHTQPVALTSFSQDPSDSKIKASIDITDDIPAGSFSGSVQAVQADGSNVGSPVSFSGFVPVSSPVPTPNMQPVPVSVTVTIG